MNDYYQFRDETGTPIDYYQLVNDNNELCKEIERLNNIIKEALILTENTRFEEQYAFDEILLPILNKLRESGIRNYIKVEGSDEISK